MERSPRAVFQAPQHNEPNYDSDSDPPMIGQFQSQWQSKPAAATVPYRRSVFFWGQQLAPSITASNTATPALKDDEKKSLEPLGGLDEPTTPSRSPRGNARNRPPWGSSNRGPGDAPSTSSTKPTSFPPEPPPFISLFSPNRGRPAASSGRRAMTRTNPPTTPHSPASDEDDKPPDDPILDAFQGTMSKQLADLAAQRRAETRRNAAQQHQQRDALDRNLSGNRECNHCGTVLDLDAEQSREHSPSPNREKDQDIEDLLEMLEETRSERDELEARVRQLNNQIVLLKRQADGFNDIIKRGSKEKGALKKRIRELTDVIEQEIEEPLVLRDRLDQASFRLRKAERRNRYVDDTDRWKADAKYRRKQKDNGALLFGFPTFEADEYKESVLKERRGAQGLIAKSVEEVVSMTSLFNDAVFQASANLSKYIYMRGARFAAVSSGPSERARKVIGQRAVSIVVEKLPVLTTLNPLLAQIVLQIFLVFWCNSIIEAWYPKQPTFAEFLVDACSKLKVGENAGVCNAKTIITQTHTRDSHNLFGEWAQDIVDDLHEILSAFGWAITGYNTQAIGRRGPDTLHTALIDLVKEAYDLRTAMAEVSTSGDVDLAIISCDTPFNPERMKDEHEDGRKANAKMRKANLSDDDDDDDDEDDPLRYSGKRSRSVVERVIGTTGIGLQKEVMKPLVGGMMKRDIQMVLKPQVVLEQSLLDVLYDDDSDV